jgi:hypothetical protein
LPVRLECAPQRGEMSAIGQNGRQSIVIKVAPSPWIVATGLSILALEESFCQFPDPSLSS